MDMDIDEGQGNNFHDFALFELWCKTISETIHRINHYDSFNGPNS